MYPYIARASPVHHNGDRSATAADALASASITTALTTALEMVLNQGEPISEPAGSTAASTAELVSCPVDGMDRSGINFSYGDTPASSFGTTDREPIPCPVIWSGSIPIGLYSVIMPTACAFLRSDGALGTLAKLMRASKSMYEACSEQLYRHLELTRKNIAGILWGLPYIPPHSLQAAIFSRAIPARTLQAIYPAHLPAILRPPHALWIDPSDAAPSLSAVGSSIIPTGASVARKVALLAMCRRLTVRECPSASDAATITSQHAVHTALGSIFHGVRYLQLAAGIHETLSDYYQRLHLEHPFVQVLKDLTPEIGCIDTTPIWTEADHRRSHIGEDINCLPPSDEALNSAIQGLWRQRPKALWTWRSDSWGLNDTILKYMRYHHPYQSGLVRSDSTSCRHQVVFSKEQGEQPLESLRNDWSGVAQTIGHQLSSAFNGEHRQLPYYDIICPAPQCEVDNQETAEMRKAALLEDIEQRIWLKLKKLPMAEAAKKITFLSPAEITACPCCGR